MRNTPSGAALTSIIIADGAIGESHLAVIADSPPFPFIIMSIFRVTIGVIGENFAFGYRGEAGIINTTAVTASAITP
jgi:hypothetical protein